MYYLFILLRKQRFTLKTCDLITDDETGFQKMNLLPHNRTPYPQSCTRIPARYEGDIKL